MPGPLRKESENTVERTPLVENSQDLKNRPPASNNTPTSEPGQDAPVVEDNDNV